MTGGEEPQAAPAPGDEQRGLAGFARTNAVVVVSLAGALTYVAVSLGQAAFYAPFGVDPAEVGLGYTETLTRTARVFLPVVVLAGVVLLMIAGQLPRRPSIDRTGAVALTIVVGLLLLVVVTIVMPVWYSAKAEDVRDGEPLRPEIDRLFAVVRNPLGIRAEPVEVTWAGDGDEPYPFRGPAIYLGRADGVAVLYDPRTEQTVRVPDSEVVIVRED
jgi:hypothetical protein